jgi:DNA-binding CsgD family transcriptional regulator
VLKVDRPIPPIVRGRDGQLKQSEDLLKRVADSGHGCAIVVKGLPGIGKTCVMNEILQRAEKFGYRVARHKADEGDEIAPMGALLLALRSGPKPVLTRENFEMLAPADEHPLSLIDRVIALLEEQAASSPIVIALDDLQWADALTVSSLRIMPARLSGLPVVWLIACRTGNANVERSEDPSERTLTEVHQIALGPLSGVVLEEIVKDRLGSPPTERVRRLLDGCGGNPFLAVELLDCDLNEGIGEDGVTLPPRLQRTVSRRLEALSQEALRLVHASAVFGRPLAVKDAARTLDVDESFVAAALEEAADNGVLKMEHGLISFRHDLVRQTTYECIDPTVRNAFHHAILRHLVESGRDQIEAVPHVIAGSADEDAAADVLITAARSIAISMPAVAARLAGKAFSMIPETDPRWFDTGQAVLGILAQCRHGRQVIEVADRLTSRGVSADAYAMIQARTAWPLWYMGEMSEIIRRTELAVTRSGLSDAGRAEMDAFRALALSSGADYQAACDAGVHALDQSRRAGSAAAETTALRALAETATNDARYDEALDYLRQISSSEERAKTEVQQILLLQLLDRYEESSSMLRDAHRRVERPHGPRPADVAFAQLWHNYTCANFDDAEADALTLINNTDEVHENTYAVESQLVYSRLRQIRGDFATANRHIELASGGRASQSELQNLLTFVARTFIGANEGDYDSVLPFVRDVVRTQTVLHRWRWQPGWLVIAMRTAVRAGDPELANETVKLAEYLVKRNPNVLTLVGILEQLRGLLRRDLKALQRATHLLEQSPRRFMLADALADYGEELLLRGHRRAAIAILERSFEQFGQLGATSDVERVVRFLQKAGARGRRWALRRGKPLSGWDSLTRTEQRVARLIAEGHTNRAAAAILALSPNTIATHLRVIFGKLGVNSRVQLTRSILALPPDDAK